MSFPHKPTCSYFLLVLSPIPAFHQSFSYTSSPQSSPSSWKRFCSVDPSPSTPLSHSCPLPCPCLAVSPQLLTASKVDIPVLTQLPEKRGTSNGGNHWGSKRRIEAKAGLNFFLIFCLLLPHFPLLAAECILYSPGLKVTSTEHSLTTMNALN